MTRLAEIEARVKAATKGPLTLDNSDGYSQTRIWKGCSPSGGGPIGTLIAEIVGDSAEAEANGELFAHAPADLEWLIARVRELERALEARGK
jgi:hypothetical protein